MTRPFAVVIVLGLMAAACGSPSVSPSVTPIVSATPTPTAKPTPTPSPSPPSLNVTPLIPELTSSGLVMMQENGTMVFAFPLSKSFSLFSPFGNDFLASPIVNGNPTSLVAIQPDGSLQTLQPLSGTEIMDGVVGALDGHAWAWLDGKTYSSPCSGGVISGTLDIQTPTSQPEVVATIPSGGATTTWSLGGWVGDDIWLIQQTGCPRNGGTTAVFIAHKGSTTLTPVQTALGPGCGLTGVALDGSMLCVAQTAKATATTWRFVPATGAAQNFSPASLPSMCTGHGTLQDFEGFALAPDGQFISVDAVCGTSSTRFDQLFIISTSTGTTRVVDSPTYLAADSWLPDDTLLAVDLSNPGTAQSYLVTSDGTVSALGTGEATWAITDVEW
jgi:hypothetical protein